MTAYAHVDRPDDDCPDDCATANHHHHHHHHPPVGKHAFAEARSSAAWSTRRTAWGKTRRRGPRFSSFSKRSPVVAGGRQLGPCILLGLAREMYRGFQRGSFMKPPFCFQHRYENTVSSCPCRLCVLLARYLLSKQHTHTHTHTQTQYIACVALNCGALRHKGRHGHADALPPPPGPFHCRC